MGCLGEARKQLRMYNGVEGGGLKEKEPEFGPQECAGENEQGNIWARGNTVKTYGRHIQITAANKCHRYCSKFPGSLDLQMGHLHGSINNIVYFLSGLTKVNCTLL